MPGKKIKQAVKKAKNPRRRVRQSPGRTAMVQTLDQPARAWLKLLNDPCGADLVRPCYSGTGAGYVGRQRLLIAPNATANDFILEFTPCMGMDQIIRTSWATPTGSGFGTATVTSIGGLAANPAIVGRVRCVAACVKVIYLGAESARKGMVSMWLTQGSSLGSGEVITGNAYDWAGSAAYTRRMGEVVHECKWAPGPGDEHFRSVPGGEEIPTNGAAGSSVCAVIAGAEPGSFYLELIFVYEWQPSKEVYGSRQIASMTAPASRNPPSEILRALGDMGKWAIGQAVTSGMRAAGIIATQALPNMTYAAPGLLAF